MNKLDIQPDDLAVIGMALFGAQWQTPLAHTLDVNDRTVRRWAKAGAPPWIAHPLICILDEQISKLENASGILVTAHKAYKQRGS